MLLDIFVTVFLVLMNGFFVAAEFAIVKVRASQLEIKARKGDRFAILGKHIVSHLDGYLAATQLGITFASLGLGWIGEPVVSQLILAFVRAIGVPVNPEIAHALAIPVAFCVITVLHIVFGELAPKSIAIQRSEITTLTTAYPLHFFYIIFRPFIWLLNGIANALLKSLGISPTQHSEIHSSDELKLLVRQGGESGTIKSENLAIINNAFDFSERTAKQVMIPRSRVSGVDIHGFSQSAFQKLVEESYSRIPCFDGSLDQILGVVYLKDLLIAYQREKNIQLKDFIRPAMFVPESKRIGQLLRDFQKKHQQMAIVVSEFGGAVGIITMEDILEELVGEIQDEYDSETHPVEKLDERNFSILASSSIHDINSFLPHPIERDKQYETLGGYLLQKMGRIPNTNEKFVSDNYEFTVMKKSKSSIILVNVRSLLDPAQNGPKPAVG